MARHTWFDNDLAADGDGSGMIDAGDYDVWKLHYGEHAGNGANASTAVPEPTTPVLLLTGILTLCSYRRAKVSLTRAAARRVKNGSLGGTPTDC